MAQPTAPHRTRWFNRVATLVTHPAALALVPAIMLFVFWIGGEFALMLAAAVMPAAILIAKGTMPPRDTQPDTVGMASRTDFAKCLDDTRDRATANGHQAVVMAIAIEDFDTLIDRYGQATAETIAERTGGRLMAAMRTQDTLCQISDSRFGICSAPVHHLDLETCIQFAARVQAATEEPLCVNGVNVYASVAIGFCQLYRAPGQDGNDWMHAASAALREALRRGPAAIRAFSYQMRLAFESRAELCNQVRDALESGQIQPWFQPQISTETGQITGFEALARWQHPERGVLPPAEFIPALESMGLMDRLAELVIYYAFAALKAWDGADEDVPQIGINFSPSELGNPRLTDKIQWELDRFDLTPDRLTVEVLETVVAVKPDDMITRNINALGALGCRIDLDDFGTGHASITSIRRFAISRIKIDRSFVTKADRDAEQQRMISAILTMAERLEVETLAEGVETVGEHVLLAQLGCQHVQGYGIARPMPFDQTLDWITRHNAKLENAPRIMDGKRG